MSFLMVTRIKIIYDRYMHSGACLHNLLKACRELVQYTVALTSNDRSPAAAQWRHDVAYSTLVLLRSTVAVLEFQSDPSQTPWAVTTTVNAASPLLAADEAANNGNNNNSANLFVRVFSSLSSVASDDEDSDEDDSLRPQSPTLTPRLFAHTSPDERTLLEEACRAPIVLSYNLRKEILKQRDGKSLDRRVWVHPCNEELRLLGFVADFDLAFSGLRQLVTTPLPFPFVNMARIFLFLWIFTVPFSICHFDFRNGAIVPVTMIVLITFGFMGMECVSIELSDPFGEDPSDFDDLGLAQVAFEDCYLAIYQCDGDKWAKSLHDRIVPSLNKSALDEFRQRYKNNWQSVRPNPLS
jgi:predicted membrane chloride channel (bestrophin family)